MEINNAVYGLLQAGKLSQDRLSQYHGMKITQEDEVIKVDQKQYTKDILKRFDVLIRENDKRSYITPMERDL